MLPTLTAMHCCKAGIVRAHLYAYPAEKKHAYRRPLGAMMIRGLIVMAIYPNESPGFRPGRLITSHRSP